MMGLGVEPGSAGTALNAPLPCTLFCTRWGGKWGRGQMGTEGKHFRIYHVSLCVFVTIKKVTILL